MYLPRTITPSSTKQRNNTEVSS